MPIRQVNLELNLKSFPSVANLTRHKYIFSRVKSTSCALIRSDWLSGSMRRQLSLDPLPARAERCVTERGARTGLMIMMLWRPSMVCSGSESYTPGDLNENFRPPSLTFVSD